MALCNAARVTLSSLSCLRLFCVAVPCPRFLDLSFLWPHFHDNPNQGENSHKLCGKSVRKNTHRPLCSTAGAFSAFGLSLASALYSSLSGCIRTDMDDRMSSNYLSAFLLSVAQEHLSAQLMLVAQAHHPPCHKLTAFCLQQSNQELRSGCECTTTSSFHCDSVAVIN